MSEYEIQFESEIDYVEISFDGNTVVSGNRQARLSQLPNELRVHSWRYEYVKRLVDLAGAIFLLILFMLPCVLIAAMIAMTSRGSVFYREWRVGRGGRPFRIWKFRSMHTSPITHDAAGAKHSRGVLLQWRIEKKNSDPRLTSIGGFLRRWSLDELPQLINVLRGEMSLIGPRPVIDAEIPLYGNLRNFYLAAAPGLSGLWQVSGRSNVSFAARATLDASYVQNWSLTTDFAILLRTIPAVLGRVGAR